MTQPKNLNYLIKAPNTTLQKTTDYYTVILSTFSNKNLKEHLRNNNITNKNYRNIEQFNI